MKRNIAPRLRNRIAKVVTAGLVLAVPAMASAADLDGADIVTGIGTAKTVMLSILGAAGTILLVQVSWKLLRRATNKV
jgi:hypothetical protein